MPDFKFNVTPSGWGYNTRTVGRTSSDADVIVYETTRTLEAFGFTFTLKTYRVEEL